MSQPINGAAPSEHISPVPLPFSYDFQLVRTDQGQNLVAMQLHTATGLAVLFMEYDDAQRFGQAVKQAAGQARSGLIIPRGPGLN